MATDAKIASRLLAQETRRSGPARVNGRSKPGPNGHVLTKPSVDERLALLEALMDRIPDFFYVHDAELRFQYANRAAAEYFGCDKEALVGLRHRDVDDDPEQAAFYEQTLIPIIERGEPVVTGDLPYHRRDGTTGLLQAHIVPFTDPNSGRPMMLGLSRDVTSERRIAEERAARAAIERELEIARRVQASLLPRTLPTIPGFALAARCEPAAFVGGDFYDAIPAPGGRTVLILGDVTGHGVGSALIAASCRSFARVLFAEEPFETVLPRLDQLMHDDLDDGLFVTLAALELDPNAGTIRYLSAGHGPIVLLDPNGQPQELPVQTTPLGLALDPDHPTPITVDLPTGSALLIPSDGLFESQDPNGQQLGIERLVEAVAGARDTDQRLALAFETESVWRGENPAHDDRTAIIVQT